MLTKYGGWTSKTVKRGDLIRVQGREGLPRRVLPLVGADLIRVQGFVAKDGSPYMSVGRVWLTGGRTLVGKP